MCCLQAEWNVFSNAHKAEFPVLTAAQADMVFDTSGGAPLYLSLLRRLTGAMAAAAAIAPGAVSLQDVWPRMLLDPEVARIYYNIKQQVIMHLSGSAVTADQYLAFLTATVAGRPSPEHAARDFVYDHRYYYRAAHDNRFSCSSGFARDATLEAIRDSDRPLRLVQSQGLIDAMADALTPAAQRGWIAEQFLLGKVRHYGLLLHGLLRNAAAPNSTFVLPDHFHVFLQQLGPADPTSHCVSLYQPRISNFPHVDAVMRIHPQQFAHSRKGDLTRQMLNYFLPGAPPPAPANILTGSATAAKMTALANSSDSTIIIGVQVTIATPIGHLNARQRFVQQAAAANSIWGANIPAGNVQYHFHWIVRRAMVPDPPLIAHAAAGGVPAHFESYSALEDYLDTPIA